jgi:hypothetical protein
MIDILPPPFHRHRFGTTRKHSTGIMRFTSSQESRNCVLELLFILVQLDRYLTAKNTAIFPLLAL